MREEAIPSDLWEKEKDDPEKFFEEAAILLRKRPCHDVDGDGEGKGWWCGSPRLMRSLLVLYYDRDEGDDTLNVFQKLASDQLLTCSYCVRNFVAEKAIWKATFRPDGSVEKFWMNVAVLDVMRMKLSWGQVNEGSILRAHSAAINTTLEVLLDVDLSLSSDYMFEFEELFRKNQERLPVEEAPKMFFEGASPPHGLYALVVGPFESCASWAEQVLSKYGQIESETDIESLDRFFTNLLSRVAEARQNDSGMGIDDAKIHFASFSQFWKGLGKIFNLLQGDMLRLFLLQQKGVVDLLLYGVSLPGSHSALEVVKLFTKLFTDLGYKFWLAQGSSLGPAQFAELMIKWYSKLGASQTGRESVIQVVEPFIESLAAFDPNTVRDVYENILTLLSRLTDVHSSYFGNMRQYASAKQSEKELRVSQELLVKVALSGYKALRPDVPSKRVDYIRSVFNLLQLDVLRDETEKLFRIIVLTDVKNAISALPSALGSVEISSLPQPFEIREENVYDIDPKLSPQSYIWNATASFQHRCRKSPGETLLMELTIYLNVLEYVHFLDLKGIRTESDTQRAAANHLLQVQDSLADYFAKFEASIDPRTRAALLPSTKTLLASKIGLTFFCSHSALRQKSFQLAKNVLGISPKDDTPIEIIKRLLDDSDRDLILDSIYATIWKVNKLPVASSLLTIRTAFHWLPLLFSTSKGNKTWEVAVRRSLARDGLFNLIDRTVMELPKFESSDAFQPTAVKVVVGLRKLWEFALSEPRIMERHSKLLSRFLGWARLQFIAREWTNTVEELSSRFGNGDKVCENSAALLLSLPSGALKDTQIELIRKLYPEIKGAARDRVIDVDLNMPVVSVKVERKDQLARETLRVPVREPLLQASAAAASAPDITTGTRKLTKMERMKMEMQEKLKTTEGSSRLVLETSNLAIQNQAYEASKVKTPAKYDKNVIADVHGPEKPCRVLKTLADLHKTILFWRIPYLLSRPTSVKLDETETPSRFNSSEEYSKFWEPFLIEEVRAGLAKDYNELCDAENKRLDKAGPFMKFKIATPPEKKDSMYYFSIEFRSEESTTAESFPSSDDIVIIRIVKPEARWEALALVAEVGHYRDGVPRKYFLKMPLDDVSVAPGVKVDVAMLSSLVTYQRQYEALWKIDHMFPRMKMDVISARNCWRNIITGSEALSEISKLHPYVQNLMERYLKSGLLNSSQLRAIRSAIVNNVTSKDVSRFTLLQGPPGTGKTSTIVSMISLMLVGNLTHSNTHQRDSLRKRFKILVCAPSNAAVDEICERVMKQGLDHPLYERKYCPRILRIGSGVTKETVKLVTLTALSKRRRGKVDDVDASLAEAMSKRDKSRKELEEVQQQISKLDSRRKEQRQKHREQQPVHKLEDKERDLQKQKDDAYAEEDRRLTEELTKLHRRKDTMNSAFSNARKDLENTKEEMSMRRQEELDNIVSSAAVVFSTLNSSGHQCLRNMIGCFDCVIIDEAAQAIEPERPSHCVMVGDAKQLPATVLSNIPAVQKVMSKSLFERLEGEFGEQKDHKLMLTTQYRMHPDICEFPSRHFYDGLLENAPKVKLPDYDKSFHAEPSRRYGPVAFYDTTYCMGEEDRSNSGSLRNLFEVQVCLRFLKSLLHDYPKDTFKDSIAILSPYRAQVGELKNMLARNKRLNDQNIEVSTIDGIQGREKDIIIISTVRTSNNPERGSIGFVKDQRRMNVAITRAKYSLVVIGNSRMLENERTWRSFLTYCRDQRAFLSLQANGLPSAPRRNNSSNNHEAAKPLERNVSTVNDSKNEPRIHKAPSLSDPRTMYAEEEKARKSYRKDTSVVAAPPQQVDPGEHGAARKSAPDLERRDSRSNSKKPKRSPPKPQIVPPHITIPSPENAIPSPSSARRSPIPPPQREQRKGTSFGDIIPKRNPHNQSRLPGTQQEVRASPDLQHGAQSRSARGSGSTPKVLRQPENDGRLPKLDLGPAKDLANNRREPPKRNDGRELEKSQDLSRTNSLSKRGSAPKSTCRPSPRPAVRNGSPESNRKRKAAEVIDADKYESDNSSVEFLGFSQGSAENEESPTVAEVASQQPRQPKVASSQAGSARKTSSVNRGSTNVNNGGQKKSSQAKPLMYAPHAPPSATMAKHAASINSNRSGAEPVQSTPRPKKASRWVSTTPRHNVPPSTAPGKQPLRKPNVVPVPARKSPTEKKVSPRPAPPGPNLGVPHRGPGPPARSPTAGPMLVRQNSMNRNTGGKYDQAAPLTNPLYPGNPYAGGPGTPSRGFQRPPVSSAGRGGAPFPGRGGGPFSPRPFGVTPFASPGFRGGNSSGGRGGGGRGGPFPSSAGRGGGPSSKQRLRNKMDNMEKSLKKKK